MKVRTFICNMLHENCYLVYDEISREAVVIDPGFYWDEEKRKFSEFVQTNNLKVKYLLCTHLHFDHIFGSTFIEDTYDVKLSASPEDNDWITNFARSAARFGIPVDNTPRPVDHPLHDGDTLMIGTEELKCIATPGHSAGGMCFYIPSCNILFAGDTLFQSSIGRTDFADGNYAQLINSIQKQLFTLPSETIVYPGHGDPTSIEDEIKYNPYL